MKPKLSICIPTYNRAKTLREALDSILPQVLERPDLEIFISDNASTDDTIKLVHEYQSLYPIIRYSRNSDNLGFDGNVIACVENSNGEYINFFSDDDIALPGTLERIMKEIETYSPAILYANHYGFDNDPLIMTRKSGLPQKDITFSNGKQFFLFCTGGFISALTIKSLYAKKYTQYIRNNGRGYAHMNYTARVAINEEGPFRFIGSMYIAGRRPSVQADWLTYAGINVVLFFQELYSEGLIDLQSMRNTVNSIIAKDIVRMVLVKKCLGDYKHLETQKELMLFTFKGYFLFYVLVAPILLLPVSLIKTPYLMLRFIIKYIRKFCIKVSITRP